MNFNWRGGRFQLIATLVTASLALGTIFYLLLRLLGGGPGLNVQIASSPASLDPARMTSYQEKLINGAIYQSLFNYDPRSRTVCPAIADKWQSLDGKVYTFTIRKGAVFQNNAPVTADDVKYSWERVLDPRLSSYGYLLQNVTGSEAAAQGKGKVGGIEVLDSRTLKVTLKETDWTFPAVVSSPALAVVSRRVVQLCGNNYGKPDGKVIGSGPFRLVRWEQGTIHLQRNKNYPGHCGLIRSLTFTVERDPVKVRNGFDDGSFDILADIPAGMKLDNNGHRLKGNIYQKPVLSFYYLGFEMGDTVFGKSWQLRKAVDLAIDRQDMTRRLLGSGGQPLVRLLPEELNIGAVDGLTSNSQKEKSLQNLAAAGFPYGVRLQPVTFTFNDSPGHSFLAQVLQAELGQVGIEVQLEQQNWSSYLKGLKEGRDPFFRLGWDADYAEPGNILASNFAAGGCNNFTGYNSDHFNQYLKQARAERDPNQRYSYYQKAEIQALTDLPEVPLFQRVAVFLLRKDVKNFSVDLLGRIDFSQVGKNK